MSNTSLVSPSASDTPPESGPLKVSASIVKRAQGGDQQALITIFRQFLPPEEKIFWTEYLGFHGWIFGKHSFGCLTERRVADVTIGHFGEVIYQDGYLEAVNSGVIYQPSKLALYIAVFIAAIISLWAGAALGITFGATVADSVAVGLLVSLILAGLIGLVLINMAVRLYYATRKCGLVMNIKEGIPVYVFADRKRLQRAHAMFRMATDIRDHRISQLGHIG
jgi:hypothetical protein